MDKDKGKGGPSDVEREFFNKLPFLQSLTTKPTVLQPSTTAGVAAAPPPVNEAIKKKEPEVDSSGMSEVEKLKYANNKLAEAVAILVATLIADAMTTRDMNKAKQDSVTQALDIMKELKTKGFV